MSEFIILYEDAEALVIDKPGGLPIDTPRKRGPSIEARLGDAAMAELLLPINDESTHHCVNAERALLAALDGSCRTPIAGLATLENGRIRLRGEILTPDGREHHMVEREGPVSDAAALGYDAGAELKRRGGPSFFTT